MKRKSEKNKTKQADNYNFKYLSLGFMSLFNGISNFVSFNAKIILVEEQPW